MKTTGLQARPLETLWRRWLKFNAVGVLGFALQLGLLEALVRWTHLDYLLATAIAVECTVIHNFVWHERYTWTSRNLCTAPGRRIRRLAHFNLTNGAISVVGNLLAMRLLVGELGLPLLAGNGLSVLACSVVNYFLCDRWIFQSISNERHSTLGGCYES